MFEIKHLKTLATLASTGNIRKAADVLFVSQSALSHQIKDLEQRLNTPLFFRNTSPVQFTTKGEVLLKLAGDILPKINNVLSELKDEKNTVQQLHLAIACHACFQWLLPVTKLFSQQFPVLNIEFIEQVFPAQLDNKVSANADILFTDEKTEDDSFIYQPLGTFEVVAVLAKENRAKESGTKERGTKENRTEKNNLTSKPFLSAADFSEQVLLTYPVKTEHLDIFKLFLNKELNKESDKKNQSKANTYKPKAIKQVANSHMILQMVAANMGIATLPDWLVISLTKQSLVQTKRIGKSGIFKTLYARYKVKNKHLNIIEQLIPQTVAAFDNLYQQEHKVK